MNLTIFLLGLLPLLCHTYIMLLPDGDESHTYSIISDLFGVNSSRTPDQTHPQFGPHIGQRYDDNMNRYVFSFFVHEDEERNEMEMEEDGHVYIKGFEGDNFKSSWSIKLTEELGLGPDFSYIHKIEAVGAEIEGKPLIAINLHLNSTTGNKMLQILNEGEVLHEVGLEAAFLGRWILLSEVVTFGVKGEGKYHLRIWGLGQDAAMLLEYFTTSVVTWKEGMKWARQVWGLERSLKGNEGFLKNETILHDYMCFSKNAQIDYC